MPEPGMGRSRMESPCKRKRQGKILTAAGRKERKMKEPLQPLRNRILPAMAVLRE